MHNVTNRSKGTFRACDAAHTTYFNCERKGTNYIRVAAGLKCCCNSSDMKVQFLSFFLN